MGEILTVEEVREALYLDFDYPSGELVRLSQTASSFIKRKTAYDFSQDAEIEPLAKQAAIMYVRDLFFQGDGYNKDHDYTLGIQGLIVELEIIGSELTKLKEIVPDE